MASYPEHEKLRAVRDKNQAQNLLLRIIIPKFTRAARLKMASDARMGRWGNLFTERYRNRMRFRKLRSDEAVFETIVLHDDLIQSENEA